MGRFGEDTGASYGNSEGLLAGSYNVAQRRKEVMDRLSHSIEEIERMDIRNLISGGAGGGNQFGSGGVWNTRRRSIPEDIVVMQLRKLEEDIGVLQQDVEKYEGPHFTRAYRTAQGFCAKLQTDLDALDVTGREDIRQSRKDALMRIDKLAKQLASQAHPSGKSCVDCEVKD